MASSPLAIINCPHHVFLSFRGEDIRKRFRSHFLKELSRKLITFKDDEMERGQSIAPELIKAIQGSKISVVAFSKNFANSSWCLDELVEIMKCRKYRGLIVIPIFYDVDPSHVKNTIPQLRRDLQQDLPNLPRQDRRRETSVADGVDGSSNHCRRGFP
ncbi:hypothetical protein Bca4012_028959 [Brassica carinata]|uniref:disease resistance protein RPS6-like n=1 Tax=Brassica napus TaxID=3708 RepID=UPI0020796DBD|nr:disease resistance protein RPS6-like [Brassica napus]